MLEHKLDNALINLDQTAGDVCDVIKTLFSNTSSDFKVLQLYDIKDKVKKRAAKISVALVTKEAVIAGLTVVAKSSSFLAAFIGKIGIAVMSSFFVTLIGMFLKGVLLANVMIAIVSVVMTRFMR